MSSGLGVERHLGDYASYCRMVKSERISNGKTKGHGNRKCGNRYLAWAWIEAANFALRFSPPIRHWYERKCSKRHNSMCSALLAESVCRWRRARIGVGCEPAL
jgi:hypothetical protein